MAQNVRSCSNTKTTGLTVLLGRSEVFVTDQKSVLDIAVPSENLFFWHAGTCVEPIVGHSEQTSWNKEKAKLKGKTRCTQSVVERKMCLAAWGCRPGQGKKAVTACEWWAGEQA